MPLACFDAICNVSAHWKHAEGMSLRYGVALYGLNGKLQGAMIMHCCRIVNGIKNKKHKNSLGATWNALHLAEGLCALRHWKRVSMSPTTQPLRHPLTRAHHIVPRIKTARRFTAKNPWWYNDSSVKNCIKFLKTITNILVGTLYFTSAYNWYNALNINHLS